MQQFPGDRFFKMVDQRLRPWVSTLLLVLFVVATAIGLIAFIGRFGVLPLAGVVRDLSEGRSLLPSVPDVIATLLTSVLFGATAWFTWRWVVMPTVGRLDTAMEAAKKSTKELEMATKDLRDRVIGELEGLRARVQHIEKRLG